MGKRTPRQPAIPDPRAVGGVQTDSNIQTAIANSYLGNANETSPYGSVNYNQIGSSTIRGPNGESYEIPQFQRDVSLSPEQQALYDQQTSLGSGMNNLAIGQVDRLSGVLGQPMSLDGLPASPSTPDMQRMSNADVGGPRRTLGPDDFSADRQRVEEALMSRINPQIAQDQAALESNLVNQGFARGSQGFADEMGAMGRQSNDARMQAILAGGQEQSRLFGMELDRGRFENDAQQTAYNQAFQTTAYNNDQGQREFGNATDARERALQEMLAMRNQPINEISALMNGGQVTAPQFAQYQGGQVANTPIGDYQYNTAALQNQQYQQKMQQQNAMMGGLFGLGQAGILGASKVGLMGFSDRRLKQDITDTGVRLDNGIKVYSYRYLWEDDQPQLILPVGVMADEVEAVMPEAVHEIGGFKMVDYGMVMGA